MKIRIKIKRRRGGRGGAITIRIMGGTSFGFREGGGEGRRDCNPWAFLGGRGGTSFGFQVSGFERGGERDEDED